MSLALEISNLGKTYSNQKTALSGIDLKVNSGDFFALLGPNGAGKSTTIGILCSLVTKSFGKVSIFGHDLDTDLNHAKACLGIVPQEINFNQFETCLEVVMNQAGYYGLNQSQARHNAEIYLKQLSLWDRRHEVSRNLSGGLKRRLMIARALVHEPRLLILDEPTAGVDVELRRSMWDFLTTLNQRGTTIVLTTHYLEEAERLCKNIAIIDKGKIIENTSMRALLKKLKGETYLFESRHEIKDQISICGAPIRKLDEFSFEVDLPSNVSMNTIFQELSDKSIEISSMRTRSNRLEELFLNLVEAED